MSYYLWPLGSNYNNEYMDNLSVGQYVPNNTIMQKSLAFDEYNNRISKQIKTDSDATEKEFDNSINMIREGQNITSSLSVLARDPKKGSNRSNPKETKFEVPGPYSNLSDDELRKIVNRMQLERQYGDLSGDAKYTLTGREKTREYLQTIGALLGIGVSALTIYKLIRRNNNNKSACRESSTG